MIVSEEVDESLGLFVWKDGLLVGDEGGELLELVVERLMWLWLV